MYSHEQKQKHFEENKDWLIENNHLVPEKILEKLKISRRTLNSWKKYLGLPNLFFNRKTNLKYKEREFIEPYKLGWCLGLFSADGYLAKKKSSYSSTITERVSLCLAISDEVLVRNFFNILLIDPSEKLFRRVRPSSIGKQDKISAIATVPEFIKIIKKFLTFKNKTYDVRLNIDEFSKSDNLFKMDFLRGLIDGDGYVNKTGSGISIVSASENFLLDVQKMYGGQVKKRKNGICWDIFFKKDEVFQLWKDGLNYDEEIILKRKTERINKNVLNR